MADRNVATFWKVCTTCGVAKVADAANFSPQRAGKYGFTASCRPCNRVRGKAYYATAEVKARYAAKYLSERDRVLAERRDYYRANRVTVAQRNADWRRRNAIKLAEKKRAWRLANPEKTNRYGREQSARIRAEGGARAIRYRVSRMVSHCLRSAGAGKAGQSWCRSLGYGPADLKRHLERQFLPGMSWRNFGRWHIDHIVPVSSFSVTGLGCPEFRACWALSNLRPLWAVDNMRKGASRQFLL